MNGRRVGFATQRCSWVCARPLRYGAALMGAFHSRTSEQAEPRLLTRGARLLIAPCQVKVVRERNKPIETRNPQNLLHPDGSGCLESIVIRSNSRLPMKTVTLSAING